MNRCRCHAHPCPHDPRGPGEPSSDVALSLAEIRVLEYLMAGEPGDGWTDDPDAPDMPPEGWDALADKLARSRGDMEPPEADV